MKKLFAMAMLAMFSVATINAQEQTKVVKEETKVKKTSTVPQKVHNTFSKHKRYSGKKITHTKKVENSTTTK